VKYEHEKRVEISQKNENTQNGILSKPLQLINSAITDVNHAFWSFMVYFLSLFVMFTSV
jgi:hypothetical protein